MALCTLLGCGGDPNPYSVERYCEDAARTLCAVRADCCAGFDADVCRSSLETQCLEEAMVEMERGRAFDSTAARTCANGLDALYTDCNEVIRTDEDYVRVATACRAAWGGTRDVGEPCDSSSDCAADPEYHAVCEPTGDGTEGRCAQYPTSMPGVSCDPTDSVEECPVAYYCDEEYVCKAPRPEGSPCPQGPRQCSSLRCEDGVCVADPIQCT